MRINVIVKRLALRTAPHWASAALGAGRLSVCISLLTQPHCLPCSILGTSQMLENRPGQTMWPLCRHLQTDRRTSWSPLMPKAVPLVHQS